MKHALLAASLVLVGGSAVACGGGGAPTDASKEDFCDAFTSLSSDMGDLAGSGGEAPDEDVLVKAVKDWAEELEEVGAPEGMSEDARGGFVLSLDEEKKQAEAFNTYTNENCGNPLEELMPSEPAS